DAKRRRYRFILEAVSARKLVLPALASRLSDRFRSGDPRSRRGGPWAGRLGPALLELLQAEPQKAAPGLRIAKLAGRAWRQPALRAAALWPKKRRQRPGAGPFGQSE